MLGELVSAFSSHVRSLDVCRSVVCLTCVRLIYLMRWSTDIRSDDALFRVTREVWSVCVFRTSCLFSFQGKASNIDCVCRSSLRNLLRVLCADERIS